MTIQPRWARRVFLKKAGQGLAALPLMAAMPDSAGADEAPGYRDEHDVSSAAPPSAGVRLNVRDFGAAGDGRTKDTLPVQLALDRCSVLGGGEVFVPAGDYLTGALAIRSNTVLRIDAGASLLGSPDLVDYPITEVRWEGRWIKGYAGYLCANDAENIAITGAGKIIGNAAIAGRVDRQTGMRHPALIEFTSCRNVFLEGCVTRQNDMWSIHPVYCDTVTIRNLIVQGGADGIDVDSCRHVVIEGCSFDTGDDCISLKSGRGEEGNVINRPTEDVRISNCTFVDHRWACIGIGSETSAGIRDVHVEHCKCAGAGTYAIYIKSRPGRGAFIENIYMKDLDVSGTKQGFLRLNFADSGKQDEFPVPGLKGVPTVAEFHFSNIRVTDVPVLVEATGIDPRKPLNGFSLVDVVGTCGKGIFLANTNHAQLRDIRVTDFTGSLLNTSNVNGAGLAGAAKLQAFRPISDVPETAEPYVLK
jgi:polygalacturonase